MANDTEFDAGSGGDEIRTFDDGTRKWPASFICFGPVSDPGPIAPPTVVSTSNPLPVVPVGTVVVSITGTVPLPTGAATEGTLSDCKGLLLGLVGGVTVSTVQSVVHVDDNSASLTVDAPVGAPVFVRLSDGSSSISTLPVSLASVPSHAVTNAGTFAVQAAQSGTWNVGTVTTVTNVVHVDDNSGSLTVDGTVAATQSGTWNVGTVTTVSAVTSITNVVHVDDNGGSLTVDGTVTANQGGTWNVGTVTTVSTVSTITNVVHIDDNSGSITVDGTVAATQSGTWNVGTITTVTTVSAVTSITNALPAGTNTLGGVSLVPRTSGGLLMYSLISANNTNATVVKVSAGQVEEIVVSNTGASPVYLKLYNKATTPTSSDTPVWRIMVPGSTSGTGIAKTIPKGLAFSTGIAFRIVSGVADNDNSNVNANEVLVNLGYA